MLINAVVLGIFVPIMLAFIVVPVGNSIFVIFGLGCGILNPIINIKNFIERFVQIVLCMVNCLMERTGARPCF